jgi:hypothetical protein
MELIPQGLKSMLDHSNRWRGVELAGWTAFVLMSSSVGVFTFVTKTSRLGADIPVPSLLYPYFAAVSVFFTTCIWILSAARLGVSNDLISDHRFFTAKRWFKFTLVIVTLVLLVSGLSGDEGLKAAKSLNWYLFGPLDDPMQEGPYGAEGLPFALLASVANALALATLVYLGALCNGLILGACENVNRSPGTVATAVFRIVEAERRLKSFLVMASALMVTSTLTLYLSFAAGDQIQVIKDAHVKRLSRAEQPADSVEKDTLQRLDIDCQALGRPSNAQSCTLKLSTAVKAAKPASSAAYMALVAGLSFTGILFILFTACGAALSDLAGELARKQIKLTSTRIHFNLKAWREETGLADSGAGAQAVQGLALVAPALTGLLTLVNS